MWGVVGRDDVDRAVEQRFPQRLLMPGLTHRRLYAQEIIAEPFAVIGRQKQVMRTGLDREVDAALLGKADMRQRMARALVRDMNLAAGPFGEDAGAADRLD